MYSGEMEYVAFHAPFVCEGPVETWLFNLTVHTHECLKTILVQAVAVYEDKPKHEFVLDWYLMIVFSFECRFDERYLFSGVTPLLGLLPE